MLPKIEEWYDLQCKVSDIKNDFLACNGSDDLEDIEAKLSRFDSSLVIFFVDGDGMEVLKANDVDGQEIERFLTDTDFIINQSSALRKKLLDKLARLRKGQVGIKAYKKV